MDDFKLEVIKNLEGIELLKEINKYTNMEYYSYKNNKYYQTFNCDIYNLKYLELTKIIPKEENNYEWKEETTKEKIIKDFLYNLENYPHIF